MDGRDDVNLFGVLDGHGPYGEVASYFCYKEMENTILSMPDWKAGNLALGYEKAFPAVHDSFVESTQNADVDAVVSGTTAIATLCLGTEMITANVGDSRCIMCKNTGGTMTGEPLSDDHKPQRPDERKRLDASSAVLLTEKEVRGCGDDDKVYVCRERDGDIVYGVLFTRSVGDFDAHQHLGVTSDAEMLRTPLNPECSFLVLASDGVWDHIDNQQVVDLVKG